VPTLLTGRTAELGCNWKDDALSAPVCSAVNHRKTQVHFREALQLNAR